MNGQDRFRRLSRFLPRKRWKESTAVLLTWDAVRTSLEVVLSSADICPPLKSAVGGVIALCNIAERAAACDENAEILIWRAVAILDTMYQSIDTNAPIPSHLLNGMVQFEQLILEIRLAMKVMLKRKRVLSVLHLRRSESQLAKFTARLDSVAEVFTIGSMTVQTMSLCRIEDKVESVSQVTSALERSNTISLAASRIKWMVSLMFHPRFSILMSFSAKSSSYKLRWFFWPDPNIPWTHFSGSET
ncbi:hypothetical protein DFH08DRAFT_326926 [Mycena albidolilacea]|uniref:Uncharacterized protein n=1 Tax=Mycena albidolilacea TaxID=1033008 RepID=A0AAD7ANJ6_9AGAR|nr:hypothetical protein DFH08DRAFT_326926 [Mycena albidolilacea]